MASREDARSLDARLGVVHRELRHHDLAAGLLQMRDESVPVPRARVGAVDQEDEHGASVAQCAPGRREA
jgi:hypothetical protein